MARWRRLVDLAMLALLGIVVWTGWRDSQASAGLTAPAPERAPGGARTPRPAGEPATASEAARSAPNTPAATPSSDAAPDAAGDAGGAGSDVADVAAGAEDAPAGDDGADESLGTTSADGDDQAAHGISPAEAAPPRPARRIIPPPVAAQIADEDEQDAGAMATAAGTAGDATVVVESGDVTPDEDVMRDGAARAATGAVAVSAGAIPGDGTATCPASHPIKGNASSMIFHEPGRASYERTIPEFCFAAVSDAEEAGYRPPPALVFVEDGDRYDAGS